jgi:hypothetical protein
VPTRDELNAGDRKRGASSSPVVPPRRALPLKDLPADKPLSLLALARIRCSRTARHWEKTVDWLANNREYPSWLGIAVDQAGQRPGSRWKETWEDRLRWQRARLKQSERYDQVARRSEVLHVSLVAAVREVLASPGYLTQGEGPDCIPVEVPRGSAHQLMVDLANSSLSTSRGMTWEKVTVRRSQRRVGRKNDALGPALKYLRPLYPDGRIPDEMSIAELERQMRAAGVKASQRSITRALKGLVAEAAAREMTRPT